MFLVSRSAVWILLMVVLSPLLLGCENTTIEPTYYGALEGVVLDGNNNNTPLANAVITTNPATTSFTTDAQGKFGLDNLAVGKYALSVRKTNYTTENVNVQVEQGTPTPVTVVLNKASGSNHRPNLPSKPTPTNGATGQPVHLTLRWRATDPDKGDTLRSDVVIYESSSLNQQQALTSSRDTMVTVDLKYNTTYFWQVTVSDKAGEVVRGDVWRFQTSPVPDNRYLYVREVAGNTDIYSSDNTGGNLIRLTNSVFVETAPQLSPTRDRIAYTSNATGRYQLYTMNRDGSDVRQITPSAIPVEGYNNYGVGYHWSPDGSQLIYANNDKLWRINRDGTGLVMIATAPVGRNFRECDWAAQGNRIVVQTVGAYLYNAEIYTLNADGSNLVRLIDNPSGGRLDTPSFSIDGSRVVFSRDEDHAQFANGRQTNGHVFTQKLDGTGVVDLSYPSTSPTSGKPAGTNDIFPHYSPDGARIIFVNVNNDNISPPEVWVMDLDGKNRTKLFTNATLPDWR